MLFSGGRTRRGARLRGRSSQLIILGLGAVALVGAACSAAPELDGRGTADGVPGAPPSTEPVAAPAPSVPTPTTPGSPGTASTFRFASTRSTTASCANHPPDHFLNATNIDTLPVHRSSAAWLASIGGPDAELKFPSSKVWEGGRSGMPINVVDSRVTGFTDVVINPWASTKAYRGPYPIPPNPKVQGYPGAQWDRHLLIVDVADCTAYELIQYDPLLAALTGIHSALNGTRYRLDSTDWPAITTNSPNTPMVGQYVMLDEVRRGSIDHPVGFCTDDISTAYQWPARASDGRVESAGAMPMGTWIRLRAGADLSALGPGARVVAAALREHGAVLTDTCDHDFYLMAENSGSWDDADLRTLRSLDAADFEVVDTAPMRASSGSYRIR